jgi:NAD(P)-dependent dehydrogenase (short-subunit alcohol dehydrogenase family)
MVHQRSRTALVTGSSYGIGRQTALQLHQAGLVYATAASRLASQGPYAGFHEDLARWHAETYAGPPHNIAGRLAVSADHVARVITQPAGAQAHHAARAVPGGVHHQPG